MTPSTAARHAAASTTNRMFGTNLLPMGTSERHSTGAARNGPEGALKIGLGKYLDEKRPENTNDLMPLDSCAEASRPAARRKATARMCARVIGLRGLPGSGRLDPLERAAGNPPGY